MTYHNLLVRIKENFKALGATVGGALINAFKPVLRWINAAIQAINQFAIVVSNALGKIFGWKYELAEGGQEISGIADDYDDVADAAGGAAQKAKELNKQLQGFDELNNLTTNDNNGGGGGSGGSSGGGALGSTGKAGQWVEVAKDYESEFDTLAKLGAHIGEVWTDALTSIPWDDIKEKAESFAKGMADFFNGLISPELFGAFGQTIAESFNTAFIAIDKFATEFDWENLGNSVAQFVTDLATTFDAAKAGTAVHNFMSGVITSLTEAVDKANWYEVGTKIGDYLEKLDIPDLAVKLMKLAGKIIEGLIEAIKGFWENTDWQGKMGLAIIGLVKVAKLTGLGGIFSGLISNNLPSSINLGKTIQLAGITIACALTWKIGSNIGSSLGEALSLSLGDDELADFYARWREMNLGEKLEEIHNTISGWDSSDTNALLEFFHLDWLPDAGAMQKVDGFSDACDTIADKIVQLTGTGDKIKDYQEKIKMFEDTISNIFPWYSSSDKDSNETVTGYKGTLPYETVEEAHRKNVTWDSSAVDNLRSKTYAQTESTGYGILDKLNAQLFEFQQNAEGASSGASRSFATITSSANKLDKNGSKSVKSFDKNTKNGLTDVSKTATSTKTSVEGFSSGASRSFATVESSAKEMSTGASRGFSGLKSEAETAFGGVALTVMEKLGLAKKTASEEGTATKNTWLSATSGINTGTATDLSSMFGTVKSKFESIRQEVDSKGKETNTAWSGALGNWKNTTETNLGVTGLLGIVKSKFSTIKETVEKTEAKAKFGVDTPTTTDIEKLYNPLKSLWKNTDATFGVDFEEKVGDKVQAGWNNLKKLWKDDNANFGISFENRLGDKVKSGWDNLKKLWANTDATFGVDFTQRLGDKIHAGWEALKGMWKDHSATFSINAESSISESSVTELAKKALLRMSAVMKQSTNTTVLAAAKQLYDLGISMNAKGGVYDKATLGIFGEAGAEAVVPLERNIGWAKNVADLITAKMPYAYAGPSYTTTNYAGNSYVTYNGASYGSAGDNAMAEQNELLREEITILRQIAAKDVSISSSDVFNAVRSENRNYVNRTGNSPFIS